MNTELSRQEINVLRNGLALAIHHCKLAGNGTKEAVQMYETLYNKSEGIVEEEKR